MLVIPELCRLKQEDSELVDWPQIGFGNIPSDKQNTIYLVRSTIEKIVIKKH